MEGMNPDIYAGFWRRFVAVFIDSIIVMIICALIGFVVGIVMGIGGAGIYGDSGFINLLGLVITVVYFAYFHSSQYQATIGKQLMGCYVVDVNGNRISFLRGVGRYFATYISGIILMIGYIMAGLTQKKTALHDLIAGTYVLKK